MSARHKLNSTALVRIEDQLKELLIQEAATRQTSVSFVIREALLNAYGPRLLALAEVKSLMGSQLPYVTPTEEGP